MSKTASKDLFELIHSLSRTEKGYFKNSFTRSKSTNEKEFFMLFDLIEAQKEYSEEALIKKGIEKKRMPLLKQRLQERILKSLEQYTEDNSIEAELKSNIRQIEILFQKGLMAQCRRAIQRAKALAYENEMYESLLDVFNWERQLLFTSYASANWGEAMSAFFTEVGFVQDKLNNYYKYVKLLGDITYINSIDYSARESKHKEQVSKFLQNPFLISDDNAMSIRAKRTYGVVMYRALMMTGDLKRAYEYSSNNIPYVPGNRKNLMALREYFNALHGHALVCKKMERVEEAREMIRRMKDMIPRFGIKKGHFLFPRVYLYSFDFELSTYTDYGEYDNAMRLIRESIEIFNELEHKTLLANRMVTYFNVAYAYFGTENYKKSLEWLNKAIDLAIRTGLRQDILTASLVINLIIHYELNNDALLPYVVRSTYRQLKKKKLLFKFEKSILDFIRLKMPKIYTKKERIEAFIELKVIWDALAKDPQEKDNFSNWDFLSWLESKITGKSFAETVRSNAKNKVRI